MKPLTKCHIRGLTLFTERVALLVHILRKLDSCGITPEKLQEVAHDARRQLKPPEKIEIFDEIFRVRRMEQRYERGEIG